MGVNPKSFKQGGFLSGKDVTWTGYDFQQKTFEGTDGPFTPVSVELRFRIDGADEDVKTWLRMGNADSWGGISEDHKRLLTPEGQTLSSGNQLAILLASLVTAGIPADAFDADDSPDYISMEALVARRPRFRLETPVNEEKTEKFGQQKNRKSGRSFDRRDLIATKFYGFGAEAGQVHATNGSGKALESPTGAAVASVEAQATAAVKAVLKAAGGSLPKGKLPTKITARVGAKNPQLDAIRKLVMSVAYLESGADGAFAYDSETQTLSA